jgi:hypothetical protein
MVERRGRQIDHGLAVRQRLEQEVEQRQLLRRRMLGSGRRMPFGGRSVPEE